MESKQIGYWVVLSLALHGLLLFIPLTGSVFLRSPAVEVLLVPPEQGGNEVLRIRSRNETEQNSAAHARNISRRDIKNRQDVEPVRADALHPAVKVEETGVTAVGAMPSPEAHAASASLSAATRGIRSDDAGREGTSSDGVFGTAGGPSFVRQERPVYPFIARKLGKEGKVVLRLTIDEKGGLSHVEVVEGAGFGFTESAIEAVKKSAFAPALRDGRPILSRAILPVRFTLKSN